MSGRAERLLFLAAILLLASWFAGVAGWRWQPDGRGDSLHDGPAYFHGGKTVLDPLPAPGCRSGKCHAGVPHRKGPEAAFRNQHGSFVECPACHGADGGTAWRAERRADGRWMIRTETRQSPGDPHRGFGAAVRCRGCHSEAGRKRIERGSTGSLQENFLHPVALRMLEEGSKSWVPDGM